MATYVYIRGIEDGKSEAAWEKTRHKRLETWIAATGAKETPIRRSDRPGLTTYCYTLPGGRRVKADVMDSVTKREHEALDRAVKSVSEYIGDTKKPARWRGKALADAAQRELGTLKRRR